MNDLVLDLAFHGALEDLGVTAASTEQAGARGLFVSEAQHDPFVSLAAASGATEALELGTSVAIAFSRTPMSLAYAAHDVQRITGGRLVLGLGTQVAAHIVRRYGMPWSQPASRMREYVAALHAIWDAWETGERLSFSGDFYTHSLMSPAFSPGSLNGPRPPVWLAAVGPRMLKVAAEVADGLILHPLTTRAHRDHAVLPLVERTRSGAGRSAPFTVSAMAMVACGRTDEELATAIGITKTQIAFYASTPAYLDVLTHHGWEDLHREASACVARGGFFELGELVDDEILHAFAAVGSPADVVADLAVRHAGADRVTLTMPFQDVGPGSAAQDVLQLARRA